MPSTVSFKIVVTQILQFTLLIFLLLCKVFQLCNVTVLSFCKSYFKKVPTSTGKLEKSL